MAELEKQVKTNRRWKIRMLGSSFLCNAFCSFHDWHLDIVEMIVTSFSEALLFEQYENLQTVNEKADTLKVEK